MGKIKPCKGMIEPLVGMIELRLGITKNIKVLIKFHVNEMRSYAYYLARVTTPFIEETSTKAVAYLYERILREPVFSGH